MILRTVFVGAGLALLMVGGALAQVERREIGQLVYEGVPAAPSELQAAISPYYEVRSAELKDWLEDGSMLISTRFAETTQIHRLTAPGAARTQLTFFSEPITAAKVQPGAARFAYRRDEGGSEYYQGFLRDLDGAEVRLSAPGTRNSDFVFSKDGKLVVWSQVTPGDPNYDIMLAQTASPDSRRVVLEGQGAMAPTAISADGRRILISRYNSIAFVELFVLEVATGALTPVGPTDRRVFYEGAAFAQGGAAVVTLSDDGSEVARPVVFDLASGAMRDLSPDAKWGAEGFDLSPDGRTIAYVVN
ncbi:MAG: hypothetical protein Q8J78_10845, partial [Moraxellaceae bacterium]|nr:hypothetical protein [Moraxellaceae bacterium]